MHKHLQVAQTAARAAGEIIRGYARAGATVGFKDAKHNLLTNADLEAESVIVNTVRAAFPGHAIYSEESHRDNLQSESLWVIDPLDGTTNFAHGFPAFCTSIAYYENGHAAAGVVYNPIADEMFSAIRGKGAFLNDKLIQVSKVAELESALVCTGFYYDRGIMLENTMNAVLALFRGGIHGIRRTGSAALDLCYVACGRLDAYFELRLMPWDFAAGALIVKESGGRVGNCQGAELPLDSSGIAAANTGIFADFVSVISEYDRKVS